MDNVEAFDKVVKSLVDDFVLVVIFLLVWERVIVVAIMIIIYLCTKIFNFIN